MGKKVLMTDEVPGNAAWLDQSEIAPPTTQYLKVFLSNALPTGAGGRLDAGNDLLQGAAQTTVTVPADGDYILEILVVHTTTVP